MSIEAEITPIVPNNEKLPEGLAWKKLKEVETTDLNIFRWSPIEHFMQVLKNTIERPNPITKRRTTKAEYTAT